MKIDEVKEFIGFMKTIFVTIVAIETSLIAFLYNKDLVEHLGILLIFLVLGVFLVLITRRILNDIKKLKDL